VTTGVLGGGIVLLMLSEGLRRTACYKIGGTGHSGNKNRQNLGKLSLIVSQPMDG